MEASESLYRRGQISAVQWARLKAQKSKAQPTRMANFDDRGGVRDQGGRDDRGAPEASRSHIDKRQDMGTPARASGKPSRGGTVQGGSRQPVRRAQIDDAMTQRPNFPVGAQMRAGNAKRKLSAQSGRIPAQGGQYGGGGRDTQ